MAQAVSNQRSVFNLEQVFRGRPSPHLAGMDRSEIIPGKLRHLLESGYSVGSPALQTATDEPQLDLDRYHVVMIPRDVGSGRMTGIAATDGPLFLNWKELVSRVRMELDGEASPQISKSNVVAFGDIQVDLLSIEVRRSKRLVRLSAMEFKVLKYFLSNPDRVVSRDELLNEVWGYNNYPCTRTVDNHVLRLRHKLEPNFSNPIYLRTAAGFGYRFTPEGCVDREVTRHDPYRIKARKRGNRRSPLRASQ